MRYQQHDWSCGAACVVNAFRCFNIKINEAHVRTVAGTISPSNCAHCVRLDTLLTHKQCPKNRWTCKCGECKNIRKEWRSDECISGTDEDGIVRALKHFGPEFVTATFESGSKENAWQWVHGSLIHGRVAILCLDRWSHWSLAFGTAGDLVSVFDPYPSKTNKYENGVHVLSKEELMRRWHNGNKTIGKEKRLYAISIGK